MYLQKQRCEHCGKKTSFNVISMATPTQGQIIAVCSECGERVDLTDEVQKSILKFAGTYNYGGNKNDLN